MGLVSAGAPHRAVRPYLPGTAFIYTLERPRRRIYEDASLCSRRCPKLWSRVRATIQSTLRLWRCTGWRRCAAPGNLVFDRAGNLYGTTRLGGATPSCSGCGTVFKLSPNSDGTWTEAILYNFCSDDLCQDGTPPVAGLIFDANGNLYGTTSTGGAPPCPPGTCGTVFEMSSPSLPGAATAPPR